MATARCYLHGDELARLAPARPEMKVLFVFTFLAMGGMMLAPAISGMAKAHSGPF